MDKQELLSDLWQEAEKIVKAKRKLKQLAITFSLLLLSGIIVAIYFFQIVEYLNKNFWALYLVYFLTIVSFYIFLPFGKISQAKVKKVFDEIIFERSQSYLDEINQMSEKLTADEKKLDLLREKSNLLINIISENS